MKNTLWISAILLCGLVFAGCQTTTTYYLGAKADAEEIVSLPEGKVEAQRWEDLYVTVDYSVDLRGSQLNIDGTLFFTDRSESNYNRVWDFNLKLFLLDRNMLVVDYVDIAHTLDSAPDDIVTFSGVFPLREDVVSFTFGYEGSFIDDRPEPPSYNQVKKLPKRNF